MLQRKKSGRREQGDARRGHLLAIARDLFVAGGFHRTGIARIAEASGVKVGQIYRDFPSKEAIIAAIVEADVTAWLEEDVLAAAVAAGDHGAIRDWIGRFAKAEETRAECQMMTDVLAESGRSDRIAAIYRAADARVRASLLAALAALRPHADPNADAVLVEFILAGGIGAMARRLVHPEMAGERLGRFVTTIIERELGGAA